MSKRKKHTFTLSEAAKKKLVLNLPYCMIGLYATKLGQAWRMAEGTNLSEKLLHLGDGFASAFASSLPSFHPADLLVGLLAGLLLRLAVYLKSKDAKKFRKGREYGSARWGTRKDIEPFIDPVFKNNILLTQTERLTMNSRPKDPRTARNKNVLVIGGSGSGKTRYLLKPNLMQCHSSYVITDPKGSLLIECGHLLEKKKYQIRFFNTINFKKSLHYNPFHYIHSEKDILKLANVLITNTDGGQKSGDPFWRNAEMLLYCALMGYIFYLRADFPHDAYWISGTVTLDDGYEKTFPLAEIDGPQRVELGAHRTRTLTLDRLIKCDNPSAFPALRQIEVYGR